MVERVSGIERIRTVPTKTFQYAKDPSFCQQQEQIKDQAVKTANQSCEIGGKWEDWNDLTNGTNGKSAHGKMTLFHCTYVGVQNTYSHVCQTCPKIFKDAWAELKTHQENFK